MFTLNFKDANWPEKILRIVISEQSQVSWNWLRLRSNRKILHEFSINWYLHIFRAVVAGLCDLSLKVQMLILFI